MICYLYEAPQYIFFSREVPELLYYSHIPAAIIALLLGGFVYLNTKDQLLNKILFLISICFSGWVLTSLTSWTNVNSDVLLFAWTFYGVFFGLISILCIYFVDVFVTKQDISFRKKIILTLLISPVLLFAHTNLSLRGFDLALCDAFRYEGLYFKIYTNILGLVAMLWIAATLCTAYLKTVEKDMKKQILLMGVGIELFLFTFFSVTFFATYLTTIGLLKDSRLEMFSLFGMTFFMVMMGVLIVRFKTFKVTVLASQALMLALVVLVASQFTYVESVTSRVLTSITLILTAVSGLMIVRNVKKEIAQRTEIEKLAVSLKRANKRLKALDQMKSEFVSIASHQLRSPLTSIRGYTSMLLEGSFGKVSPKVSAAIERIADSSTYMASSIEDYLSVSRIEAGNMKYELSDFNLKTEAEHVVDDKRQEAIKKGLLLTFKSDMTKQGIINADIGKTRQILHNLVNNAIKYTPRGTVTIFAHDDPKKKMMYVDIIDSGIGMKAEELEDIFGKFERAHNANQTNVTGTGLGLFVARMMARQMKGEVTAHSEGVGHGSTFSFEIPLHM